MWRWRRFLLSSGVYTRATPITCSDTCVIAHESCSQDEIKHLDSDLYEKKTKFCLHIVDHWQEAVTVASPLKYNYRRTSSSLPGPGCSLLVLPHRTERKRLCSDAATSAHTIARTPAPKGERKPQETVTGSENMSLPASEESSRGWEAVSVPTQGWGRGIAGG